ALVPTFDFDDIYAHLDSRLDSSSDKAAQWFRENTREEKHGYSFLSEGTNALVQFRTTLTDHVAHLPEFFIQHRTKLIPRHDRIWRFLRELDEIVELAYFLVSFTSGGTPRGSDAEGLRYVNTEAGQRHVYMYNGMLAIITVYSKTLQNTGRAVPCGRFPPAAVSRNLIILLNTLYDTARYLAVRVMPAEEAESYSKYIFVLSGDYMRAAKYSSALSRHTERTLFTPLGLRDVRQLLDSVLKQTTRSSFDEGDEGLSLEEGIDQQTGHSSSVAQRHYAVDFGAIDSASLGMLTLFQSVSVRWHCAMGFACPSLAKEVAVVKQVCLQLHSRRIYSHELYEVVVPILTTIKNELAKFREDLAGIFRAETRSAVAAFALQVQRPSMHAFPPIEVHPNLRMALQRLNPQDPNPQFKSPEQAEIIQLLLGDIAYSILLVSPTGYGKTFMVSVIAALCPKKVLVVITPFVSTTRDLCRRLDGQPGVNARSWDDVETLGCSADENVMVVSAHLVNGTHFRRWTEMSKDRIQAIVIDECHEMLISSYRKTFEYFTHLSRVGKSFVFLTATLFPASEPNLLKMLEIDGRLLRVFRVPTYRPNIAYKVEHRVDQDDAIDRIGELLQTHKLAPGQKGLIYCTTRAQVEAVAKKYKLPFYHAQMDPDDEENNKALKEEVHMNWMYSTSDEWAWAVATLAFGSGIDNSSVMVVIHLLMPALLRFLQESGRLGRTGQKCFSYTLSYPAPSFAPKSEDVHLGVQDGRAYVETTSCRRLVLGRFDGGQCHSCGALPNAQLCDNCEKL
ncbi:hypothetical protein BDZ89DRAFT_914984, partial [Hymenopellis radicata]